MKKNKPRLRVITGNGKGKTTSAMGIMAVAATERQRIYFGQFMKHGDYSEIAMLRRAFPEISIDQYDGDFVLAGSPREVDKQRAELGLERALAAVQSGEYDLVVLDEINVALFLELIGLEQVLGLIDKTDCQTDLVLTGRYAASEVLARADCVYEMLQVKHYFYEGVAAREGIEY